MTSRNWFYIIVAALLVAFHFTVIGPMDYADELDRDADRKLMRAQVASRSEHITTPAGQISVSVRTEDKVPSDGSAPAGTILPLLHPLGCGATWIKHCSDWEAYKPCETICLEER